MQYAETNIFPKTKKGGIQVGYTKNDTYYTTRNYISGQIFRSPKYKNAIGLDTLILKDLLRNKIKKMRVLITGYEKISFEAEITLKKFVLEALGEFDFGHGKQYLCPMNKFDRIYPEQKHLKDY